MAKSHVLQIRKPRIRLHLTSYCRVQIPTPRGVMNVHCGGTGFEEVSLYTDLASFFFSFIWETWAFGRARRARERAPFCTGGQ